MPEGIQRKRVKGWRMPPNTISVCRPSVFGNPFKVEDGVMTPAQAVEAFDAWLDGDFERVHFLAPYYSWDYLRRIVLLRSLRNLRGLNLACYCPIGQPCHRDSLLKRANK